MSDADHQEFSEWIGRSPAHLLQFMLATAADDEAVKDLEPPSTCTVEQFIDYWCGPDAFDEDLMRADPGGTPNEEHLISPPGGGAPPSCA